MRFPIALMLAILPFAPAAAAADDGIHVRTIENGLTVVVKEDHSKPLAALRIYVKTGGAFEMEFLGCGISHYYEHLLSGGTTENRTEEESAKILMELGGQNNAYTSSDHTCYHIVTHRDFLGRAIALYGDWMMHNTLDPAEVEREKGVILKEINMGEDEPSRVLSKLFAETMFRRHPIRVPTIGYRENFERITREDLVRYYENRYSPNNSIVAVAGDVDPEEVFAAVEKEMGAWERRPVPVVILPPEPRQTAPRYAEKELDVELAWVRMGYHTIDLFHPDLYALDMVSAVLSQGRSSRLFRRVVEEERLTDAIDTYSYTPWFMTGTFGLNFQVPVEKLPRMLEVLQEEIERIKAGPVTEEELARAKVLIESRSKLGSQTVQDQAIEVGRNVLSTGDPRFNAKYLERMREVTPEQVVAAARKYLVESTLTTAVLKPIGTSKPAEGETTSVTRKYETVECTLENGLRVIVKRIPGAGPAGIEMYGHGGLRAEPVGKNGVSHLTARLLVKGTRTRSAEEIARRVEEIGAGIGSQSGNNTIGLSMTLARGGGDLEFAADLLADVLANSTFPSEEFEKEKAIAIRNAARQSEVWQTEVIGFMRRELFGVHPYGNPAGGSAETLAKLTRDDVLAFAERWLRPEGMVLAVVGDVDPAKTVGLLDETLGKLPAGEGCAPPSPPMPAWEEGGLPADRSAFLANQKRQAVLCLAFPGPRFADYDDRAALQIVDAFTSGLDLPSGWFHTALRGGGRSLVYFIHLVMFSGVDRGAIWIYTQARPDLLKTVHDLLMEQIERLREGRFTDEELEIGRSMALVFGPYRAQAVNDLASELALGVLYGGGATASEEFQQALKKVTREDVMRVVRKYFSHMLVLGTGPEEAREIFDTLR